jgi:hypothetical protein
MKKNIIKKYFTIFLTAFLFSNIFFVVSALAAADWKVPEIEIQFPQKLFSDSVACDKNTDGTETCHVPWIAEYISAIYNYAVGIVGIIAVVVMMLGGVLWMTAGGSAGRVTEARAWITAAITGLVLILASYTILYTVNPDLVNLKFITIRTPKMSVGGSSVMSGCSWKTAGATAPNTPACSTTEEKKEDSYCPEISTDKKTAATVCCCPKLDASMCIAPWPCKDCNNCANAQDSGITCKPENTSCYLNQDLINKLLKLQAFDKNWQITEGWPPHWDHGSGCHASGDCADINVTSTVTQDNVKNLYNELKTAGFSSFGVEAYDCSTYLSAGYNCTPLGGPGGTGGSGVHIHVNNK